MYSSEDLKRVYFQYQTEAVTRGQRWQLLIIASSVQLRCRDGLHGNTLVKFLLKYLTVAEIFQSAARQYRIGNMPTFSISENNESLLLNCRAKKMYEILNKQVKFLTSQYIGTCKSAYTKGYALN